MQTVTAGGDPSEQSNSFIDARTAMQQYALEYQTLFSFQGCILSFSLSYRHLRRLKLAGIHGGACRACLGVQTNTARA